MSVPVTPTSGKTRKAAPPEPTDPQAASSAANPLRGRGLADQNAALRPAVHTYGQQSQALAPVQRKPGAPTTEPASDPVGAPLNDAIAKANAYIAALSKASVHLASSPRLDAVAGKRMKAAAGQIQAFSDKFGKYFKTANRTIKFTKPVMDLAIGIAAGDRAKIVASTSSLAMRVLGTAVPAIGLVDLGLCVVLGPGWPGKILNPLIDVNLAIYGAIPKALELVSKGLDAVTAASIAAGTVTGKAITGHQVFLMPNSYATGAVFARLHARHKPPAAVVAAPGVLGASMFTLISRLGVGATRLQQAGTLPKGASLHGAIAQLSILRLLAKGGGSAQDLLPFTNAVRFLNDHGHPQAKAVYPKMGGVGVLTYTLATLAPALKQAGVVDYSHAFPPLAAPGGGK